MRDLSKRDPFRSAFSLPSIFSDLEDFGTQRGLKVYETEKEIVAEAVVADRSQSYQYYYTTALSGGQWDKADAEVHNGVVKVIIPKTEAVRPRKIAVREKVKDK